MRLCEILPRILIRTERVDYMHGGIFFTRSLAYPCARYPMILRRKTESVRRFTRGYGVIMMHNTTHNWRNWYVHFEIECVYSLHRRASLPVGLACKRSEIILHVSLSVLRYDGRPRQRRINAAGGFRNGIRIIFCANNCANVPRVQRHAVENLYNEQPSVSLYGCQQFGRNGFYLN